MHIRSGMIAFAVAVSLAAGCRSLPQTGAGSVPSAPPAAAPAQATVAGAIRYQIDSARSQMELRVFRAGRLARLGHNHVIGIHEISGEVALAQPVSASTFSLRAAKAAFVVDDPQARARAGSEFPADLPEEARSGTRRNMLSESLLSAAAYPDVYVNSLAVSGQPPHLQLQVAVTVLDHPRTIQLPVQLLLEGDRLHASGEVEIAHEQLGLTPFSALLGALKVQESFTLRYSLSAVRQ